MGVIWGERVPPGGFARKRSRRPSFKKALRAIARAVLKSARTQ